MGVLKLVFCTDTLIMMMQKEIKLTRKIMNGRIG